MLRLFAILCVTASMSAFLLAAPPIKAPPEADFGPRTAEERARIEKKMAEIKAAFVPEPPYELPEVLLTKAVGPVKRRIRQTLEKGAGTANFPERNAPAVIQETTVQTLCRELSREGDRRQQCRTLASLLNICDQWLARKEITFHRAVSDLAQPCRIHALVNFQDPQLAADITDVYLLPCVNAWREDAFRSKTGFKLVVNAYGGYLGSKQFEKAIAVGAFEVRYGESSNQRDGGRIQMAKAHREAGQYAEAIRCLEAITDQSLIGAKQVIPELEKQLAAQKSAEKTSPKK